MKKMIFLMAIAIAATVMTACSNDFGLEKAPQKEEPTTEDPKDNPQPQPEPKDTTGWRYSTIMDQTVDFNESTEMVQAMNISELTRKVGNYSETKLDSAQLRYQLSVEVAAPTRVVVMSPDTAVYAGKGKEVKSYGDFVRQGTDSLHTVTTTVEGGFKTQYYTVGLTTSRVEGYSLHAGKWIPYLNVTESAQLTSIWHEPIVEVELNDSIFDREVVHNMVKIAVKGNFTPKYISREKVVIVDHFLRMKESEPNQPEEPEHNHPDWWGEPVKIIGQGTFVYKPGVGAQGQGQFFKNINILFENVLVCVTTKSYVKGDYSPIDFDWDNALVYTIGSTLRGKTITSKNVSDLNSVIWRDGKWEAACCTYDQKNYSWTYMCPDGHDQGMTEYLAETCGLKNFAGKHTARLHPSLFYSASLSNGTLVIKDDNGRTIKSFH